MVLILLSRIVSNPKCAIEGLQQVRYSSSRGRQKHRYETSLPNPLKLGQQFGVRDFVQGSVLVRYLVGLIEQVCPDSFHYLASGRGIETRNKTTEANQPVYNLPGKPRTETYWKHPKFSELYFG